MLRTLSRLMLWASLCLYGLPHHHEFPAPDATAFSFSHADFPAGLRPQMTLDQRGLRLQVSPVFRKASLMA